MAKNINPKKITSIGIVAFGRDHFAELMIKEIEIIGGVFYSKLPEPYRLWWKENKFLDDMYLGLWVAWLLWLRAPSTIPQAIGAVARSGLIGILICIIFFC